MKPETQYAIGQHLSNYALLTTLAVATENLQYNHLEAGCIIDGAVAAGLTYGYYCFSKNVFNVGKDALEITKKDTPSYYVAAAIIYTQRLGHLMVGAVLAGSLLTGKMQNGIHHLRHNVKNDITTPIAKKPLLKGFYTNQPV